MQAQLTQNFAIFKRISTAIVLICVSILAVNLYLMQSQSALRWYQSESEQLGRSLSEQAAKLIVPSMQSSETDLLDFYVDAIKQNDFVQSATIFAANGERLHPTTELESIVDMVAQTEYRPLIFVEDIIDNEGNILGYLKLVLDREQVTIYHRDFVQDRWSQTIITIALSIIIAALLTRMFYKFRFRHYIRDGVAVDERTSK